ncbi:elongation factor P maturation arginine rhamnosyltransferase EarP [Snodgrassella sp. B3882]|uniref:elongation factor P maturation arginine rhamnosyltransferase EarP n=1 Tax=Snodgrassella sp. B3882 TaxID=2818037 RepID=UPI00226A1E40|nr:elongation factor P maturation arginine rhamnosyltransferase EarP [Snodgrassella sp. B3882]MCX8744016.1 elongation factor P maturation arginine rhamnosyltransferase EarP [Snodgrassella sp. B3882]
MQQQISRVSSSSKCTADEVWVFVRVIDNWGDVGVGWRLCMQLACSFPWRVRLWIDDVAALGKLVLAAELAAVQDAVMVEKWSDEDSVSLRLAQLADPVMVIETFGCDLPSPVLRRMQQCQPLWLNWEYLTAEDWAVDLQAMPSLQGNGLAKYFWFMGIDQQSGGLLREANYLSRRNEFLQQPCLQQAFKQQYGLPLEHVGQLWLIFAYTSERWAQWLSMWRGANEPITLWLAGHEVVDSLRAAGVIAADALQQVGDTFELEQVTMVRIPFVPQSAFDNLLWLADGAIVRGEDSFVRALWAGLPFLWHIYQQEEAVHLQKLDAYWHKASINWPASVREAVLALSADLNGGEHLSESLRLRLWQNLRSEWQNWVNAASTWSDSLHLHSSAMERLARFRQIPLK